jgi:integrase
VSQSPVGVSPRALRRHGLETCDQAAIRAAQKARLGLPAVLRSHLAELGLEQERPELFTTTPERHRMRVHDLRGTFITVSLANGHSESWISDRIGHRSSQMIAR